MIRYDSIAKVDLLKPRVFAATKAVKVVVKYTDELGGSSLLNETVYVTYIGNTATDEIDIDVYVRNPSYGKSKHSNKFRALTKEEMYNQFLDVIPIAHDMLSRASTSMSLRNIQNTQPSKESLESMYRTVGE